MTPATLLGWVRLWRRVDPEDRTALAGLAAAAGMSVLPAARRRRRLLHLVWTLAIVAATVPFFNLHAHTHWYKVGWIPFVTPPIRLRDIAANVVLYMPFGATVSGERGTRRLLWRAILTGGALSFAAETSQLFSHGRFPSSTDLVCNVIGAALGAWAIARARPARMRQAGPTGEGD
jgi:glycopeptide antibiotics resistance protein